MKTQEYELISRMEEQEEKDCVGLGDIVNINGITGYLDFIGQDVIVIVDEDNQSHKIAIKEIYSVVKISRFIKGNMTNVPIKSLLSDNHNNKLLTKYGVNQTCTPAKKIDMETNIENVKDMNIMLPEQIKKNKCSNNPKDDYSMEKMNSYIINKAKEYNHRFMEFKEEMSERYHTAKILLSDVTGIYVHESYSLFENIENLLSIACNNTIAGIHLTYYNEYLANKEIAEMREADRLMTENEDLIRNLELLSKKVDEIKDWNKRYIVFAKQNGFLNEFLDFLIDYKGNIQEDFEKALDSVGVKH